MNTRKTTVAAIARQLWVVADDYLKEHRLLRRACVILIVTVIAVKFLLVMNDSLRPSPVQEMRSIESNYTKLAQVELQRTHTVSGRILDSVANDDLINFYTQFSSPRATSLFLERFANAWEDLATGNNSVGTRARLSDLSLGIYDGAGRLRAWFIPTLTSPPLDTIFLSTSVLERRSRLSQIDSNVQQLSYSSYRRIFSKQGIPIGYVAVRRALATRRWGDTVLEGYWNWNAGTSSRPLDRALRFVSASSSNGNRMLLLDSSDRGTSVGYFTGSGDELRTQHTNSTFAATLHIVQGSAELLLLLFLFAVIIECIHATSSRPPSRALHEWAIVTGALLIVRIVEFFSGGIVGLVRILRPEGLYSFANSFPARLFSPAEDLVSAILLLASGYIAIVVSKSITSREETRRTKLFFAIAVLGAFLIPTFLLFAVDDTGLADVLVGPGGMNLNGHQSELLFGRLTLALISFLVMLLIGAGHRFAKRVLRQEIDSVALSTFVFWLLSGLQFTTFVIVAHQSVQPVAHEFIWGALIATSALLSLLEEKGRTRSVVAAIHPAIVFMFLSSSAALVATTSYETPSTSEDTATAVKLIPSPTQVLVEYIASTADSTTRSASVYNTRAYNFWRAYLSRNPALGAFFSIKDAASGKILDRITTPDVPLATTTFTDTMTGAMTGASDQFLRSTELVDSSGGIALARLLGGTRPQLAYSLSLARSQEAGVLPIARMSTILWGRDESGIAARNVENRPLHLWTWLVLLAGIFVFGLFLIQLLFRVLVSRSFRVPVALQERILLILLLATAAVSVVVYLVSDHTQVSNADAASREVFSRSVAQVRHVLQSTTRGDSLGIIERHITSAAEQLNCDIALYDENNMLLASSMPDCYRFNLLPVTLPSALSTTDSLPLPPQLAGAPSVPIGNSPVLVQAGRVRLVGRSRPIEYVVLQRQESYEALNAALSTRLFDTLTLASLALLVLGSFVASRLVRPLQKMRSAADEIATGSVSAELPAERTDEIGALVHSFNRMIVELSARREQVAQIEREGAWKEMARQVAHEIKNPLTPMKLSVQHVQHAFEHQDSNFPNIFRRVLRTISEQIDVLTRIATEFARFGEMPRRRYSFITLRNVVESAVALFEAERSHIRFAVDVPENLSKIYADEEEFRRALVNLIKNAVQAIFGWGIILINAEERSGLIYIKISDSGIGMKPETVGKAFDPNFSTKTSGMGLGLAIVKKTITDMSGTIRVESELGKGTTFYIELPARDPNAIQG